MSFPTLLVIVLAGLGGPLLGLRSKRFVPVVVGELAAGVLVGRTGLGVVHARQPGLAFLGEVGFAMLMLTVGMHLPLRDPRLRSALSGGALLATLTTALAIPAALLAALISGQGDVAVYAVLLASGSAAVLLPAAEEAGLSGSDALAVIAQVSIADVITIVSVPIVVAPSRAGNAALGAVLVAGAVVALLIAAHALARRPFVHRVRRLSKQRSWALDLRVSLLVLFLLASLATQSGTSVLVAGFGAGVTVALLGGPKRLSNQVRGIADGFFVPLYFVVLGARLDLRGLIAQPTLIALAAALAALNLAIHLAAASLARRPPSAALAASAQLGVPAAIASLGLADGTISGALATAILAAALVSLPICSAGVQRLLAREHASRRGPPSADPRATAPPAPLRDSPLPFRRRTQRSRALPAQPRRTRTDAAHAAPL